MGIRLNKRIGYVLRRPAAEWRAMRPVFSEMFELNLRDQFLPWANEHIEEIRALLPETSLQRTCAEVFLHTSIVHENYLWTAMGHCVSYSDEGGDPEIVIMRPIAAPHWFRRDDTLDYYDEKLRFGDDKTPHVEYLDQPIYPQDERSRIPVDVAAFLVRLGIPHMLGDLREAIYTCWD